MIQDRTDLRAQSDYHKGPPRTSLGTPSANYRFPRREGTGSGGIDPTPNAGLSLWVILFWVDIFPCSFFFLGEN